MPIIFHIDVDSFFVSAHCIIKKDLKNKPVVVSTGEKNSIIVSASYQARKKGINAPMGFLKAKKLVPNLVNVTPNYNFYSLLSSRIFTLLKTYTLKVEIASIDEWYLDVSQLVQNEKSIYNLAKKIQKQILDELKLPISIGIGNNKFVAKMSTSIQKPFGITITKPSAFQETFWNYPIEKYFGIGKKTASKLKEVNIHKIKHLANANPEKIKHIFGIKTKTFIKQANGQGDTFVDSQTNELKSIGNSQTFLNEKKATYKAITNELLYLLNKITQRAKNKNFVGQVLRIAIRNEYEVVISKQVKLERKTNEYELLAKIAIKLFEVLWKGKNVTFISMSLNNLTKTFAYKYQSSIFDAKENKTKSQTIVDKINQKFHKKLLYTGKNFVLKQKEKVTKYEKENHE